MTVPPRFAMGLAPAAMELDLAAVPSARETPNTVVVGRLALVPVYTPVLLAVAAVLALASTPARRPRVAGVDALGSGTVKAAPCADHHAEASTQISAAPLLTLGLSDCVDLSFVFLFFGGGKGGQGSDAAVLQVLLCLG